MVLKSETWGPLDSRQVSTTQPCLQQPFDFLIQSVTELPKAGLHACCTQFDFEFDIPLPTVFCVVGIKSLHSQAELYLKVLNSNYSYTTHEDCDCLVMSEVLVCVSTVSDVSTAAQVFKRHITETVHLPHDGLKTQHKTGFLSLPEICMCACVRVCGLSRKWVGLGISDALFTPYPGFAIPTFCLYY